LVHLQITCISYFNLIATCHMQPKSHSWSCMRQILHLHVFYIHLRYPAAIYLGSPYNFCIINFTRVMHQPVIPGHPCAY
jgi:hypothetical protein